LNRLSELVEEASDAIGVRRVFGEPYEKNGVTIIPAARIMGGAGAGEGQQPTGDGEGTASPTGSGGGFGLAGRPAGAFVVKGDQVRWLPAIDVNRLMLGFQVTMIVFLLVMRSIARARAEAARAVAQQAPSPAQAGR
jgi:uncharacterized spore protein YtfJ